VGSGPEEIILQAVQHAGEIVTNVTG